jgi:sorbitol/mannitol transport system permease protein
MAVEAEVPVGAARRPRPAPKRLTRRELWTRRGPLLPALVFAIVLTQLPFLLTLYDSLQSRNLLRPGSGRFVGLSNYGKVFTDDLFRNAVFNTVKLTVSAVVLSMVLGIAFAVVLDKQFFGRGVVRTLLITPFLVMPAATALLWKTSIFNPVFGLLNWVLSPFGVHDVDWVSRFPMPSIVMVLTWQWTPFMMLIVLAGLQSQSPEVLEAAKVDGATAWATFRRITLPQLRQFIELGVLLGSIFIVQTFDAIFMITQGGPGQATTNLPYFIYQQAFRAFDVGESAAAGVIVVAATIVIATFALRVISNLFQEEA